MRVSRPVTKMAILAAVGATVLAACGTNSNNQTIGPSGAFGKVPAATGTPHAGTITVSEPPNATPTWIMPVTPGANSSVYTAFSFQYQMWRPLYWLVNGVSPVEYPPMSLASDPVWSNSDKTVTVKLKGWKWSDGQPITSKDLLFWIDVARAAIKESPANWGNYVAKIGIPDQIVTATTPDPSTL